VKYKCDHHSGYTKGCEDCKFAARDYARQRRVEKLKVEGVKAPLRKIYDMPTIVEGDVRWRAEAACRGVATDVFFPAGGSGNRTDWSAALAVCARCPVRQACLDYALRTNQPDGVWGMATPSQRRTLRRPDPICADCGCQFPRPRNSASLRCESCQAQWRRHRQYDWHHSVGKFRQDQAS
jgi:WhiB family redox-sensing transcriptional regulator